MNYYNDNDQKAAAWLRELIAAGLLPPGEVDERSITNVRAKDLEGFRQCHFFAGIGGWALALQLAGWPSEREVWTGSCPCQPISIAGNQKGHADERHLWPAFYELIDQRRPATIFGEQVSKKLGCEWLAGVRVDLERIGYACGAADLPAASVGAPHIRSRLFWVADSGCARRGRSSDTHEQSGERASGMPRGTSALGGLADSEHDGRRSDQQIRKTEGRTIIRRDGEIMRVANTNGAGCGEHRSSESVQSPCDSPQCSGEKGFWSDAIWHQCSDGKARRISPEPSILPLVARLPGRVGLLRGSGNAIVPQVAAEFIKAFLESGF